MRQFVWIALLLIVWTAGCRSSTSTSPQAQASPLPETRAREEAARKQASATNLPPQAQAMMMNQQMRGPR